ncbi:hypothetical protein M6B38_404465 [Iris pallida]|uniref:Uncharacterized protein n=1 Tax=Iris pallida TaxID=29817 RepID=A0AAX6FRC8_IRIPA|nr:hypothetical protein M6B38_404465 [Iris pallida]
MLSPRNWTVSTLSLVGKTYCRCGKRDWVTTLYYPIADVECWLRQDPGKMARWLDSTMAIRIRIMGFA